VLTCLSPTSLLVLREEGLGIQHSIAPRLLLDILEFVPPPPSHLKLVLCPFSYAATLYSKLHSNLYLHAAYLKGVWDTSLSLGNCFTSRAHAISTVAVPLHLVTPTTLTQ